ncbi:MAG: iron-sulfur cluster-binding domain-containing protein [Cytophagales bacterium]
MNQKLKLIEKKTESQNAATLVFEKKNISYKAGQYLTLNLNLNGENVERHYSMSSHPADEHISLTIKAINNGKVSKFMVQESEIGQDFEFSDAGGTFVYQAKKCRNLVFWAAGSGISPILALLKEAGIKNDFEKCTLIYTFRTELDRIGASKIEEIAQKLGDKFTLIQVLTQPSEQWVGLSGRIDDDFTIRLAEQIPIVYPQQSEHYLCGPQGFMQSVETGLQAFGVKKDSIYKESFVLSSGKIDVSVAQEAQVTAIIKGKSHEVTVKADQTILEAFNKHKISLPHSCQGGICSACMVQCKEGRVLLPDDQSALSESDIEDGFVLTCVGKPGSAKIVLEY